MLSNGILLIATGHPYYGNMAYNLACSIKSIESGTHISVVYDDKSLTHLTISQKGIFDNHVLLPENYRTGFGAKLHADQLSPYEKTLCLDVDMLWLGKPPSELFAELNGKNFTMITEGCSNAPNSKYYFWADPEEIKKEYQVPLVYQSRSEVMYFEKGCKLFKIARSLKPEKKLKTIRMFGKWIPDELYFNIAMAVEGVSISKWMPAYWARLHNEVMPNLSVLYKDYYLLSFGSNAASPIMKRAYDNVMRVVCNKLRMPYMFKLKSKKEWAPERLKI